MQADLIFLGRTELSDAVARQKETLAKLVDGDGGPAIFVTEHEPVYTVGRAGVDRKVPEGDAARYPNVHDRTLHEVELAVVELDRGGDVTWHGPGQVVVYPVLPLNELGMTLVGYLRALERAGVDALAGCGIAAYTRKGLTGIWTPMPDGAHGKIGSIGVGCRRWVTHHGLCVNVSCDLAPFDRITPCGIEGVRVTRVADLVSPAETPPRPEELGREVALALAREAGIELAEPVQAQGC